MPTVRNRQVKSGSFANASSATVTFDNTALKGSLLVATVRFGTAPTGPAISGWTALGTNPSTTHYAWYKQADGTESAVQCSWTGTSTTEMHIGEWQGVTMPSPLDVAAVTGTIGAGTTHATGTVDPTDGVERLIVAIYAHGNSSATYSGQTVNGSATGVNERTDNVADARALGVSIADWIGTTTSGAYSMSATCSASIAATYIIAAFKVAERPGPGILVPRSEPPVNPSYGW